jgi:hypothetical protein
MDDFTFWNNIKNNIDGNNNNNKTNKALQLTLQFTLLVLESPNVEWNVYLVMLNG